MFMRAYYIRLVGIILFLLFSTVAFFSNKYPATLQVGRSIVKMGLGKGKKNSQEKGPFEGYIPPTNKKHLIFKKCSLVYYWDDLSKEVKNLLSTRHKQNAQRTVTFVKSFQSSE